MTFGKLNAILDETGLSPEQLAPLFDVASMTVRRWQKEPANRMVPRSHQWSVVESVYQMIVEGKLSGDAAPVKDLLKESTSLSFMATIKGMGVPISVLGSEDNQQDKVFTMLSQIGIDEKHKKEVEDASKKLSYFKKMGSEWQKRITALVGVIRSKKLTTADKLIAYGALFYLISPLDLIPDHLPVIGLVDDFGVLGFAVTYYMSRHAGKFDQEF